MNELNPYLDMVIRFSTLSLFTYVTLKWLMKHIDPTSGDKSVAKKAADQIIKTIGLDPKAVKLDAYELMIGVLLYGPPGCGKTLIAKAIAKSTDSFLRSRETSDHEATAMMKAQFLSLWDGFESNLESKVVIMGATNRPGDVDHAILRRMPLRFQVGMPNVDQRKDILRVILDGQDVDKDVNVGAIAEATHQFSGAELKEACRFAVVGRAKAIFAKMSLGREGLMSMSEPVGINPKITQNDLIEAVERIRSAKRLSMAWNGFCGDNIMTDSNFLME